MILAVRSIPLSKETRDAWTSNGVRFIKRSTTNNQHLRGLVNTGQVRGVLSLGDLTLDYSGLGIPVFNDPTSIRFVSHPKALARNLKDYVPLATVDGPHWHKNGGWGGKGKLFHSHEYKHGGCVQPGATQAHIVGDEFRVVTVGRTVVQSHRKTLLEGVGNFEWTWTGVEGIAKSGIIPFVKSALDTIPNADLTFFGWDIIVGEEGPKVIEINTSPGVNGATAERVVKQINLIIEQGVNNGS